MYIAIVAEWRRILLSAYVDTKLRKKNDPRKYKGAAHLLPTTSNNFESKPNETIDEINDRIRGTIICYIIQLSPGIYKVSDIRAKLANSRTIKEFFDVSKLIKTLRDLQEIGCVYLLTDKNKNASDNTTLIFPREKINNTNDSNNNNNNDNNNNINDDDEDDIEMTDSIDITSKDKKKNKNKEKSIKKKKHKNKDKNKNKDKHQKKDKDKKKSKAKNVTKTLPFDQRVQEAKSFQSLKYTWVYRCGLSTIPSDARNKCTATLDYYIEHSAEYRLKDSELSTWEQWSDATNEDMKQTEQFIQEYESYIYYVYCVYYVYFVYYVYCVFFYIFCWWSN